MSLRKATDIVRLYFVSPETVVLGAVVLLGLQYPDPLVEIGQAVARQDSLVQYLALLPLGLLAVTFALAKEMLRPSDAANNTLLYEWPDYWRLKYRSLGAIFYSAMASAGSIGVWMFKASLSSLMVGGGLLAAIIVAVVATVSQFLAYLRIREILEGGK
jgi:hypothetical protein